MRSRGGATLPDLLAHSLTHGHGVSAGQPGLGPPGHQTANGGFPAGAVGHGLWGQRTRGTGAFMTLSLTIMLTAIQCLVANFSAIEISRTSDIETTEQLTRTLTTETHCRYKIKVNGTKITSKICPHLESP